jgi:type IV pilus assembly protein PilN
MIDRQQGRNEYLKKQIEELDRQITEILGLEAQRDRLIARMEIIDKLQRSRPEVVHLVDQIVRTLPDGIYLTSVKQNDKKLEIKGVAQSSTRVSTFMRNIEASDWLGDPQLQVVEARKGAQGGADFVLFATAKGVAFGDDADDSAPAKGKSKAKAGAKQASRAGASGG